MRYYCFNITSDCNMSCPYCYRVGQKNGYVSYENAKNIIDVILHRGITGINISGGEPLLHPNWREIIQYCYEKKMSIILSTNGLLLDLDDASLKMINYLALPLDGSVEEINSITRSSEQYHKVIGLIEQYKKGDYSFKLRINTVISKNNENDLDELYEIVNEDNFIWKLFQFRNKGYFNTFEENKTLSDEESFAIIERFLNKHSLCEVRYQGNSEEVVLQADNNPIVVNYDGNVYLTKKDEDIQVESIPLIGEQYDKIC